MIEAVFLEDKVVGQHAVVVPDKPAFDGRGICCKGDYEDYAKGNWKGQLFAEHFIILQRVSE